MDENDKIVEQAMSIITDAGDARLHCKKALDAANLADFETAEAELHQANLSITKSHSTQTNAIQAACRGEEFDYNVLFAHAQDTLMTINSELLIAKQLITFMQSLDCRLRALENQQPPRK